MVVLPGLDQAMAAEEWDALGPTRRDADDPARPLETHPQYHLKLLLDRMGASRAAVQAWDAVSDFGGPAVRTPFVSLLFAPAGRSGERRVGKEGVSTWKSRGARST